MLLSVSAEPYGDTGLASQPCCCYHGLSNMPNPSVSAHIYTRLHSYPSMLSVTTVLNTWAYYTWAYYTWAYYTWAYYTWARFLPSAPCVIRERYGQAKAFTYNPAADQIYMRSLKNMLKGIRFVFSSFEILSWLWVAYVLSIDLCHHINPAKTFSDRSSPKKTLVNIFLETDQVWCNDECCLVTERSVRKSGKEWRRDLRLLSSVNFKVKKVAGQYCNTNLQSENTAQVAGIDARRSYLSIVCVFCCSSVFFEIVSLSLHTMSVRTHLLTLVAKEPAAF